MNNNVTPNNTRQTNFEVNGMTCAACQANVTRVVSRIKGVSDVSVNLLSGRMQTVYDPELASIEEIEAAVGKAGYEAIALQPEAPTASPEHEPGRAWTREERQRIASERAAAQAKVQSSHPGERARQTAQKLKWQLIGSLLFLLPMFYISMGPMIGIPPLPFFDGPANFIALALTQFLMTLPILYLNRSYFSTGFKALYHRLPNMDSLIAIGSAAALIYGIYVLYLGAYAAGRGDLETLTHLGHELYFESSATILTLITLGHFLEARAKTHSSDAVAHLMDLVPQTAELVWPDGNVEEVPTTYLMPGDTVVVRSGMSVPLDGTLTEGHASLDESALTGESIPVERAPGEAVTGATVNKGATFRMSIDKVEDTTLDRIIRLVEEAGQSKAPIARLGDKIASVFVPIVMAIALITFVVWLIASGSVAEAFNYAVSVLIISCPCALGLATPVSIMVGTGRGATHGILIRSAEALELAQHVDTIVMDKTGTITEGEPKVTGLFPAPDIDAQTLLYQAARLEHDSEHPLAEAIRQAYADRAPDKPIERLRSIEAIPGRGLKGIDQDQTRLLGGNRALMEEEGIPLTQITSVSQSISDQGATALYFARGGQLLGLIAIADTAREEALGAIQAMKAIGIHTVMLTGDNERTAQAIAKRTGVDEVIAECLPSDKVNVLIQKQEAGHKVMMIGDGINDAPALAQADVGLAIGAGTDIAIESADIVLMRSRLSDAVTAIQLSRATLRNIRQNLFWAFIYNSVLIPLAAGALVPALGIRLNPMLAAAAMSLSSVFVVTNALRLHLFRPQEAPSTVPTAEPLPLTEEGESMTSTKKLIIEGMACAHCQEHVENALNALPGVHARVDLDAGIAYVEDANGTPESTFREAIEEAGYQLVEIDY